MQQELTPQQHQAIELLAAGAKLRCIAETLGIRRETLWRWRQLPEFRLAYQERHQMLRTEIGEQILELMRLSLSSIERQLAGADDPKKYNPVAVAFQVMELLKSPNFVTVMTAGPPAPPALTQG